MNASTPGAAGRTPRIDARSAALFLEAPILGLACLAHLRFDRAGPLQRFLHRALERAILIGHGR